MFSDYVVLSLGKVKPWYNSLYFVGYSICCRSFSVLSDHQRFKRLTLIYDAVNELKNKWSRGGMHAQ